MNPEVLTQLSDEEISTLLAQLYLQRKDIGATMRSLTEEQGRRTTVARLRTLRAQLSDADIAALADMPAEQVVGVASTESAEAVGGLGEIVRVNAG